MFRRMSRIRSLVAFGAVLASAVCSAADTIIYVKPGATGEGTSWDDPAELTAALAKAAPAKVSAEVWLQEGTYEMTADSPVYMFWNKTAVRGGSGYVDEVTHVQTRAPGRTSIAVDAGNPLSDYSNETIPNGRRVNLGRYGNTPWATMARPATVIFVY